ncbi:MAG: hypothetical protein M0R76_10160 [Proteobacteria bacterium]|nr:hypothetical protein [Pseudomonadota bacterium]
MQQLLIIAVNMLALIALVSFAARIKLPQKHLHYKVLFIPLILYIDMIVLLWLKCDLVLVATSLLAITIATFSFPADNTKKLSAKIKSPYLLFIFSFLTIAALLYIYLPVAIFLTSPGELNLHMQNIVTSSIPKIAISFYLATLLYATSISLRAKAILSYLALLALILFIVYSFVLPFGYPIMNGLIFEQIPIPTHIISLRILLDIAILILLSALTLLAIYKFGAKQFLIGIGIVNLALILFTVFLFFRDRESIAMQQQDAAAHAKTPTANHVLRYSPDNQNTLILMMDRFMGGFVEPMLAEVPELTTRLNGFTWYPKSIAAGENSIAGVHPLLGGYDYTPQEMSRRNQPLVDTSTEAFSILPYNFLKKGYQTNFINPKGLGFTMKSNCDLLKDTTTICTAFPKTPVAALAQKHDFSLQTLSESNYSELLVALSLMRAMPYGAKAPFQANGPWQTFMDHSAGTTFVQWAELKSLPGVSFAASEKGQLNIFFNLLPHEPYFIGEDCLPKKEMFTVSKDVLRAKGFASLFAYQHYITAKCTLLLLADYFDWMKQNGVYDNTKIVIVSDHGIKGPVTDPSSRAVAGGTTNSRFVKSRSVLLVKELGAKGPVSIDETFAPNAEVPAMVCKDIGGCHNPYLNNKPIAADGRDNPFFVTYVPWQFTLQHTDSFRVLDVDVVINKEPYDADSWRLNIAAE